MDLEQIREFLIQQGIPVSELDEIKESPIIRDIGHALTVSLINDDSIGFDLFGMMIRIEELEQKVAQLEGGNV